MWYAKDAWQRVLFPSSVRLSDVYFASLDEHAIPLDYRAIGALQHNALQLDIYKWLAQRLWRVSAKQPAFLVWPLVAAQFESNYKRLRAFRERFLIELKAVLAAYPGAVVVPSDEGLSLCYSPPPVERR